MTTERMSLKTWADEDRPREKMLKKGISALSDGELLAILLRTGTRNETVVDLARRVLHTVNNNLDELGKISVQDLCRTFKGIGEAKAITLAAALELGRRRKQAESLERKQIKSSEDAYSYFEPILSDLPHEEFWILLLNRSNKIIESVRIGAGGVAAVVVDVKIIAKEAVMRLASGIILAHNHPSGNVTPSNEDRQITQKAREACNLLDIKLLDHIIVGNNRYYSFANEGII